MQFIFCISSFRLNDDDGKKHGNKFEYGTNRNGAWWWQAFEQENLVFTLEMLFYSFFLVFFILKGSSDSYLQQNWFYFFSTVFGYYLLYNNDLVVFTWKRVNRSTCGNFLSDSVLHAKASVVKVFSDMLSWDLRYICRKRKTVF